MTERRAKKLELRTLILTPIGRDAKLVTGTLAAAGMETAPCADAAELLARLQEGAAAAVVAQEALPKPALSLLAHWVTTQPPWSDLPFVILTFTGRPSVATIQRSHDFETLGNVTFLERPVRPDTLRGSVQSALRARLRQYQLRSHEEALRRANADLEQFAYSASHDLQEPLRNVSIYSDLLSRRFSRALDQQGQDFLSHIKTGALRMETLLRDLLAYTQAAGLSEEAPGHTDAAQPLTAAIETLTEAAREAGAVITCAAMPAVRMRPLHLQQIFQNLIGNALKYRGASPARVHVSAEKQAAMWVFTVADNGIGIQPEFKDRIFGIFKRLHSADKYSGTGIGLAICKRITERYGGRIWVESNADNGSRFRFSVPE